MTDEERIQKLKAIIEHGNEEEKKFARAYLAEIQERIRKEAEFDAEKDPRIMEWRAEGRIS